MKRYVAAVCVVMVLMCAAPVSARMPGPDAGELWGYIQDTSWYKTWGQWADHVGVHLGSAPHGSKHIIYVTRTARDAARAPLPYGSMVVKENYMPGGELAALTVMYKLKGYNPQAGDWFWAKYAPGGEPVSAGRLEGCIGCHGAMADNDYVMVHTLE